MWTLKLVVILAGIYAAMVLIVFLAQTTLLFPTSAAGGSPALPPGAERLALDTPEGERLQGLRIPATPGPRSDRTTVLGFGGNAWNAENMAAYLHELFPAAEVVAFHYRGYPPSTGRPSAEALLQDAPRIYDFVTQKLAPTRVVAVGFSVGSGVAAHLARERPLQGLILVTPFDSLEQLAREHYRWLPVRLLLRHRMLPIDDLRRVTAPVALIAAEHDTIVPERRTAPLRKAARTVIMDRTIPGAGHNDMYASPEFVSAMREAITLIEHRAEASPAKQAVPTQD